MKPGPPPEDLTGRTYGKWTVLYMHEERGNGRQIFWECLCTCGRTKPVSGMSLKAGTSTQCRFCSNVRGGPGIPRGLTPGSRWVDLTGRVFGKWTVLGFSHRSPTRRSYWLCHCECGTHKPVQGSALTGGQSTQCWECGNESRRAAHRKKPRGTAPD